VLRGQLREHVADIDELIVENLLGVVQQAKNGGVAHGVKDVLTFLPALDDVAFTEHRKLLRQGALLNFEASAEVIHPDLTESQRVQDFDSQRMSQSFEELGSETR
jgi:hypothetical protein